MRVLPDKSKYVSLYPQDRLWSLSDDEFGKLSQRLDGFAPETLTPEALERFEAQALTLPMQKSGSTGTAVIDLIGVISKRPSILAAIFGLSSNEMVRFALADAVDDPAVKQIIIRVDSPGGSLDGVLETADAVAAAAKVKPVISMVDGHAASAAMWIVAGSTAISAGPNDLVGGLGARMLLLDSSEFFKRKGLKFIAVDTGPFKSTGAPGRPIGDDEVAYIQGLVDSFGRDFKAALARGRGMPMANVNRIFTGELFKGRQAQAAGLVDRIESFDDAMRRVMTGRATTPRRATRRGTRAEAQQRARRCKVKMMGMNRERFNNLASDQRPKRSQREYAMTAG